MQGVEAELLAVDGDGPRAPVDELDRDVVAVVDERRVGRRVGALQRVEVGVGDHLLCEDVDWGLLLSLAA